MDKGIEVWVNLQTCLFADLIFISFSWSFPCADEYVYMFCSLLLLLDYLDSYQQLSGVEKEITILGAL